MPASLSDLRGFTEPALAIASVGLPTQEAISFETAFTGVRKTVNATNQELAAMEANLRRMAAGKNPIPISANELAGIAASAGQLGIATPNIENFTRTMADLGVATNLTGEEAATGLAKFANITRMPQTEFDRLGSTVVALGNNLATTESDIVAMSLRIAGAGKQVGLTQAQILSFSGALSSVGIEAESGGTAISKVFITLDQASREGGDKLKLLAQVAGTTGAKFKESFEKDAAGATVSFIEGLKKVSDGGGNVFAVLDKLGLGQIRVRDALLRASNAGDLFSKSLALGSKAWADNNALTKEAETRYATTASKLEVFQNRVKEVGIEIGDKFLTKVGNMSGKLGDAVEMLVPLANSFEALPAPIQSAAIGLAALLAAVGPAKFILGGVASNVTALSGALTGLGAAALANPVVAVAAIAVAAGSYIVLKSALEDISQAQRGAAETADKLHSTLGGALEALPQNDAYAARIKKISDEIDAAGTDVGKLDAATAKLTSARHDLQLNVKDPDIATVVKHDLDEAQALLDKQKLNAQVLLKPIWQIAEENIQGWIHDQTSGSFGVEKGQPLTQLPGWANTAVDWMMSNGDDGSALDKSSLRFSGEGREIDAALNRGSEETKRKRAAARIARGQSATWKSPLLPETQAYVLPSDRFSVVGKQSTDKSGRAIFTVPGGAATTSAPTEAENVEAARKRVAAKKAADAAKAAKTGAGTPVVLDMGEDDKAKNKREAAQNKAQAEAERLRAQQEQAQQRAIERARSNQAASLEKEASQFDNIGQTVAGLIEKMAGLSGETDSARLRAKLLGDEFAAIPAHLRAGAIELSKLVEENEKLVKQRDGLRGANNDTLRSLMRSGADTGGFLKAVQVQEKAYNFGPRIAANDNRGRQLSENLGVWARNASNERTGQAQSLRDANSLEDGRGRAQGDFSEAEAFGDVAATSAAGAKVAKIVMQRHISGASRGFVKQCEALAETNYYAAGVTAYDAILRQKGSALQTMHRFQKAGIGMPFHPGMPIAPGGLLYSDTLGHGSGHVQSGGTDGARYDQYGRNKLRESNFQWYVPPPGAMRAAQTAQAPQAAAPKTTQTSGPTLPAPAPIERETAGKVPARSGAWTKDQNRLTGGLSAATPSALNGWGSMVDERDIKPGESRAFRLAKQDELMQRLAGGEKISAGQMGSDRDAANKADWATAYVKATDDAKKATNDLTKSEFDQMLATNRAGAALKAGGNDVAGYEKQLFYWQKRLEILNSTPIKALYNQGRKKEAGEQVNAQLGAALAGFENRQGDANQRLLSDDIAKATLQTQTLNGQRDYLAQNAGKPEAVIARELELVAFRLAEIDKLKRQGGYSADEVKRLADESVARKRLSDSLGEQVALTQKLNAARRESRQENADLDADHAMAAEGMSRGDIERERARRAAIAGARPAVDAAVESGTMTKGEGDLSLYNTGEDAVTAFNKKGRNNKQGNDTDNAAQTRAQIATLRAQAALVRNSSLEAGGPDSPEVARATKLLQKKQELDEFNRTAAKSERVDVVDRLNLYNDELGAEEELRQASETRSNAAQAVTQELEIQRDIALALARTESERLDIQDRFDAKIRGNKGTVMSPEEKGARDRTRAGKEELTRINQLKSQAEQLRGAIFDGMNKGSAEGGRAMLSNWAKTSAEMMKNAIFMRLANGLTKRVTGVDLKDDKPDAIDQMKQWGKPNLLRQKHTGPLATENQNAPGGLIGDATGSALGGAAGGLLGNLIGFAGGNALGNREVPAAGQTPERGGVGGFLGSILGLGGKGKGGGESGQRIQNATIYIENAKETIQRATINANGSGMGGGDSSGGSVSTGDQRWDTVLGVLGI